MKVKNDNRTEFFINSIYVTKSCIENNDGTMNVDSCLELASNDTTVYKCYEELKPRLNYDSCLVLAKSMRDNYNEVKLKRKCERLQ